MSAGCPDPERFERLLRREYDDPGERLFFEHHLDRCESCRDIVRLDQDLQDSFAGVPVPAHAVATVAAATAHTTTRLLNGFPPVRLHAHDGPITVAQANIVQEGLHQALF